MLIYCHYFLLLLCFMWWAGMFHQTIEYILVRIMSWIEFNNNNKKRKRKNNKQNSLVHSQSECQHSFTSVLQIFLLQYVYQSMEFNCKWRSLCRPGAEQKKKLHFKCIGELFWACFTILLCAGRTIFGFLLIEAHFICDNRAGKA